MEESVRACDGESNEYERSDDAPVALIIVDSLTIRMDLAAAFEAAGFVARLCGSAAGARAAWAAPASVAVIDVVVLGAGGTAQLGEVGTDSDASRRSGG